MPRTAAKKHPAPRTSPQKPITRRLRVTTVAAKKKSTINDTSNIKDKSKAKAKPVLKRSSRVAKKQSETASAAKDEAVAQKIERKVVKTRGVHKDNEVSTKTKRTVSRNDTSKSKEESSIKKRTIRRVTRKGISSFRQMSLKESFLNQSKSRYLRSRRAPKPQRDESTLNKTEESGKSDGVNKPKVPVYKSVPLDDPVNNKSDIYDFKFDANDSKEKLKRKQRKRAVRQTVVQKLLKARAKQKLMEKMAKAEAPPSVQPVKDPEKSSEINAQDKKSVNQPDIGILKKTIQEDNHLDDQPEADKENVEQPTSPDVSPAEGSAKGKKPTVIAVENLKNKRVTLMESSPRTNAEDFKPFRPTNIFNDRLTVQNKNMLDHSLLEKSLSPIIKSSKHFDPGSPWRAPPLPTFSQVRNLYQSTPQNQKLEITAGRLLRLPNEPKTYVHFTTGKATAKKSNNTMNRENNLITNSQKKKSVMTRRKFGTEITNIDNSIQTDTPTLDISERVAIESETPLRNIDTVDVNNSNTQNASKFEENNDKENNVLNYQTPKKPLKKKQKKVLTRSPFKALANVENRFGKENAEATSDRSNLRRLKSSNEKSESGTGPFYVQKLKTFEEEIEPAPGPSGLQNLKNFNREIEPVAASSDSQKLKTFEEEIEPVPGPSGLQNLKNSSRETKFATAALDSQKLKTFEEEIEPVPGPSGLQNLKNSSRETEPATTPSDSQMLKTFEEEIEPIPGPSGLQNLKNSSKEIEPARAPSDSQNLKTFEEEIEPVPGPSGLQKPKTIDEQRILRQSNLNSFLNLVDMPETTTIKTRHGIFDDTDSAPVRSKPTKRPQEQGTEIENAFGFSDDDIDQSLSSPEAKQSKNKNDFRNRVNPSAVKDTAPARLSIAEIRNHLLLKNTRDSNTKDSNAQDTKETITVETKKSPVKKKAKKTQLDIISFSDTFDVLSETGELPQDASEVPLFADLEPSRFTQPPKHSYKRKRAMKYSFSDESESEEEREALEHKTKRRKATKMKKEDEKRLQQWIKDVNQTFDEIDQYDLLVE